MGRNNPAPEVRECFGLDYGGRGRDCRLCPHDQTACCFYYGKFMDQRSIAETLAQLEDEVRTPPDANIADVYTTLYRRHFGCKPMGAGSDRWKEVYKWAREVCDAEQIDPAMWITAQMHGLRKWIDDPKTNPKRLHFMPNMIRGDKARNRYNVYIRMAQARFKRAEDNSFDSRTDEGILLAEITGAEERIGEYYVSNVLAGQKVTEEDAIISAVPGRNWIALAFETRPSPKTMDFFRHAASLKRVFGEARLSKLVALSQVRAAFNIVEIFSHGLPDRIGFVGGIKFPWMTLARLLARLAPECSTDERPKDLQEVPGLMWGGSYGG